MRQTVTFILLAIVGKKHEWNPVHQSVNVQWAVRTKRIL